MGAVVITGLVGVWLITQTLMADPTLLDVLGVS